MRLSVCLITKNEEANLLRTLTSIEGLADEIVIVDSGSTDSTLAIAKSFNAVIYHEEWKGYGQQKNVAIEKCKGAWILLIDADEAISQKLKDKIRNIIVQLHPKDIYRIRFLTVCFGKKILFGGWSGFYRVRLFKKDAGRYNDNIVHESFVPNHDKKTGHIVQNILHYTYANIDDYLEKCNRYTTEGSLEYLRRGKRCGITSQVFSPIIKFTKMYFFKLGFLDGLEGLILALLSSTSIFLKYVKLRELYKKGTQIDYDPSKTAKGMKFDHRN